MFEDGTFLALYAGGCVESVSYYPNLYGRGLFTCFTDGRDTDTSVDDINPVKGSRTNYGLANLRIIILKQVTFSLRNLQSVVLILVVRIEEYFIHL